MEINFKGKTIIVTGATRGIGKQIANDLLESGANLILTGTDQYQIDLLNEKVHIENQNIKYIQLNLNNLKSINQFIDNLSYYPQIDGLVNNAGINKLNNISNIIEDEWFEMLNVNLTGPLKLIKFVSEKMISNNYGRIINIASIFSIISKKNRSLYSATKFGLHGLTVGVSNDLAKYNIMVNTVSPGFVETDLTRKNLSNDEINNLKLAIPSGRLANVTEISSVVQFLLSDKNTYLTGQNIAIDGGFTNV
jgi:NAD(P)-dependent dehydrogenase (short-subunit alcohol dehydrogenase family)